MVSIGFVYFCSVIKNNYELQNDGTMKNILSKRTFIVLPLFLFSLHPLWGQKSNFKNDICIPGKLYMLSDIRNDVFVEALIKRWRPYNDFVRFSGDCVYSRKLNRVASVDTPVDGSNMKIELVNSDEFEIIKEKAISICVGKKGIGTQEVTVQILGDSFVNGAFFRDALLSKNYIPGIKLVGLRNIKNEEGQYDEGRGGWTVKKYFEIPKGEMTSYHGYMQPVGEYRYWGSCEFWKNCYKVINGELTDTEIVYDCGRYDQCITKFDKETGYLAAPKKNDLMYDNARGSYMVYTEKKWKNVEVDERKWAFNYRKYLDMWNLDAPKFFAQMLGLNDYRDSLTADYREWNKKIAEMKESYYKAVPDGKFIILIPCTTCGSLNNIRGDFTLRQNAAMWQLRKNIIDTFDGRESEGYYVVDIGITIDNEKGYNRNRDGIQTGNPHPYPNYPTMGIPLAAFIQYYREL